jgi:hypothetical protein
MPIDASIYSQIQPPQDPLTSYAKLAQIKNFTGTNRLQDLQAQQLQTNLDEEAGVKRVLSGAQPGASLDSLLPEIMKVSPKTGLAYQKSALENKNITSQINQRRTEALAGSLAAVLKDPSDQSVQRAGEAYSQATGEPHDQVTNHILSLPLEQRKQFLLSTAMTNPHGQAALKLLFPEVENKDLLGTTTVKTPLSGITAPPKGGAIDNEKAMNIIESGAKSLADYSGPVPSAFALKSPLIQAQLDRAKQINPGYDVGEHRQVQKAIQDFGTGKQGNSVRSFNVALSHLDTLDKLTDALNNGDTQLINKIGNAVASQTGATAPTNFEAAKKIVGDEIVKAIVGSGGGVTDREELAKTLAAANSPAQLKGVIDTYKNLMVGQLGGLEQQYQASTKRSDFQTKYLSKESQDLYNRKKNPPPSSAPSGNVKFLGFEK